MLAFALGGCATQGPLHVYTVPAANADAIHDTGNGRTAEVPSFLERGEQLTGFAYDPFTDHFFLRLAPGNLIRVVDRPARAIKREFTLEGVPATGGGDLAIRPRDGHVFLLHPREPAVFETTRLGKVLRTLPLGGVAAIPVGIAYDAAENRLLLLHDDGRRVTAHALDDGRQLAGFTLERAAGRQLAFAANTRELYAPLAGEEGAIGVFDLAGKFLRIAGLKGGFVDVGPRSFVRVF